VVTVGIDSKEVPEDVIELLLGVLMEDFDYELRHVLFCEVAFLPLIVLVEVLFQFVPYLVDEPPLLVTYVVGFLCWLLDGLGFGLWEAES
jgi:hypothetical protein